MSELMQFPDVNILLRAFNQDDPHHDGFLAYLKATLSSAAPFGMSDMVLSSFVRIATGRATDGRGFFARTADVVDALAFVNQIRRAPGWVRVEPGPKHWSIFEDLCRTATRTVAGKLVPDAYLAALAIETGCEWVTADRDYRHFPGLVWRLLPEDQLLTNPT